MTVVCIEKRALSQGVTRVSTMTMVRSWSRGLLSATLTTTAAFLLTTAGDVASRLHAGADTPEGARLIRSAQNGPWSAPITWEGGKVPAAGARVQIRQAHTVTYDLKSDQVIRSIHVAGTLRFPPDRDTRLDVA